MPLEQRKDARHAVRLAVKYATADEFVSEYVENLSNGGLFIANAHGLMPGQRVDVRIDLANQGVWRVIAEVVRVVDPRLARMTSAKAGAGMKIVLRPSGFEDALLGYLVRLGQRRDHAVYAADIPGTEAIAGSGYRILPLASPPEVATSLADEAAKVLGVVVPPALVPAYRPVAGDRVFSAVTPDDLLEVVQRLDGLL